MPCGEVHSILVKAATHCCDCQTPRSDIFVGCRVNVAADKIYCIFICILNCVHQVKPDTHFRPQQENVIEMKCLLVMSYFLFSLGGSVSKPH